MLKNSKNFTIYILSFILVVLVGIGYLMIDDEKEIVLKEYNPNIKESNNDFVEHNEEVSAVLAEQFEDEEEDDSEKKEIEFNDLANLVTEKEPKVTSNEATKNFLNSMLIVNSKKMYPGTSIEDTFLNIEIFNKSNNKIKNLTFYLLLSDGEGNNIKSGLIKLNKDIIPQSIKTFNSIPLNMPYNTSFRDIKIEFVSAEIDSL